MTTFRADNTTGYTHEQLDELNRRYAAALRTAGLADDAEADPTDMYGGSARDALAEDVQAAFDTELSLRQTPSWDRP